MLVFAAGGQIGDLELIMPKLTKHAGDNEVWHQEWTRLATIVEKRAQQSRSDVTYSETMYLACLYQIIGEHFVPPADSRRMKAYDRVLKIFDLARKKSRFILENISIPFEGKILPAYFQRAEGQRPDSGTVIMICGLDTTKELWYLRARRELSSRGLNVLFVDTPGIGGALRKQKLYTRADYEKPIGAIIDYLSHRPDVDPEKIGIIGSSLGGYYVARAAAFEPRIKATLAWGAIYDYHKVWVDRLKAKGTLGAPTFQIMFITGTDTIEEAVDYVKDFKIAPFANKIHCPFLIMHGVNDKQVPIQDARRMLEAIVSKDKELKIFDGDNGGSAHTQFNNHLPAMQYGADWMAEKLS
jgi:dienelactone hydrolase